MNIILDIIDEESGLLLNPDAETIRIDIALLRNQRDIVLNSIEESRTTLIETEWGRPQIVKQIDAFEGIVNLFDEILDCAECEAAS